MRRYQFLSLVLSIVCLGCGFSAQSLAAQELSPFRAPAPAGFPICPLLVAQLDELGLPFQFGMPCGMSSLAFSSEHQDDIGPSDCFDDLLDQAVALPASPAPAIPMTQFEDLTPAVEATLAENLAREATGRVRRMLLQFTPDRWLTLFNSHLEMVVDLAQTGIAPNYCYGPATRPAAGEAVEEPFTDRSVANHSMTIHVVPEEEIIEVVREMLPFTLHFTPFGTAPIISRCFSQLVSDPRIMLTRDEALARDYVLDEGDLFADDGYYYDDSDCVWAGISGAVCGKVDEGFGASYDVQRGLAAAALQPVEVSKQRCATDTTWIGCDDAAALVREHAYASLKRDLGREAVSAASQAPLSEVAAAILKRLGEAMAELGERLEQLEDSKDSEPASSNDGIQQQASLDSAIDSVDEALLYLGL